MNNNLMIIAGEISGDLHGSALIRSLFEKEKSLKIFGIGGDKMIEAGMNIQFHIKDMAFLGFAEVVKHIPFIKKVQTKLLDVIKINKIKTVVLIDYPGFNLNFAKKIKKLGIKVIYYISPQIWAWGKHRIKKIIKRIDKMIVIFPFEKDFYLKHNIDTEFVGHPLVKRINEYDYLTREELVSKFKLDAEKEILLVLPGSRIQEIEKIFPEVIKAATKLSEKFNLQTVIMSPSTIDNELYSNLSGITDYKIAIDNTYDFMKHSKFGIIKSGTSTLEAGLHSLPFIVVYKTNFLTYYIARMLISIKHIAMINIISEKNIAIEVIQNDVNAANIFNIVKNYFTDNNRRIFEMKKNFEIVKEKLGDFDAAENTAEIVLSEIRN